MTAINAFATSDAVHIFSDGGWHDPATGALLGIGGKVYALPDYNAAIAATGSSIVGQMLSSYLIEHRFADFGSLAAALPEWTKACVELSKTLPGGRDWGKFDVILGGWSKVTGPGIHLLKGYSDGGWPAYRSVELKRYMRPSVGVIPELPAESVGEFGLYLLTKQRATECVLPTGERRFVVHGFAQHTSISVEGISMSVLEHWPDKVGQLIAPVPKRPAAGTFGL